MKRHAYSNQPAGWSNDTVKDPGRQSRVPSRAGRASSVVSVGPTTSVPTSPVGPGSLRRRPFLSDGIGSSAIAGQTLLSGFQGEPRTPLKTTGMPPSAGRQQTSQERQTACSNATCLPTASVRGQGGLRNRARRNKEGCTAILVCFWQMRSFKEWK